MTTIEYLATNPVLNTRQYDIVRPGGIAAVDVAVAITQEAEKTSAPSPNRNFKHIFIPIALYIRDVTNRTKRKIVPFENRTEKMKFAPDLLL